MVLRIIFSQILNSLNIGPRGLRFFASVDLVKMDSEKVDPSIVGNNLYYYHYYEYHGILVIQCALARNPTLKLLLILV